MAFTKLTSFSKKPSDLPDVPSPSMTPDDIRSMWETPLDELLFNTQDTVDKLNATTSGSSGADNIGATGWTGVANTIQALLNWLKANKTDLTGDHKGTWHGFNPSQTDPGIQGQVDSNTTKLSDIAYNAKSLGCKGDGVTDDTQAIINAISTTNGRVLYFPKGTYLVSATINFTCSVIFEDAATTYFLPKSGVTLTPVIHINNQSFKRFVNLSVFCSARDTVNQDGIVISGQTTRCYFENLHAENLNGYGIKVDTVWDSHFEKIHVESCGSSSFSKEGLWIGSTTGDTTNQCTFISIQTEGCTYYGLAVQDTAYSNRFIGIHAEWHTSSSGNNLRLGGYRCQYYGSGHLGANYDVTFIGGEHNDYNGIFFESTNVKDTGVLPGNTHNVPCYLTDCVLTTFSHLGGTKQIFNNCDITTLIINGDTVDAYDSRIGTLTHTFTGTGTNKFNDCEITTLTQNNAQSLNLKLIDCHVVNDVTFNGNNLILDGGTFDGVVTINYVVGAIVKKPQFKKDLVLKGSTSSYAMKVYMAMIEGNFSADSNQAVSVILSSILGTSTGDASSKLIKTYAAGTVTGLTQVA